MTAETRAPLARQVVKDIPHGGPTEIRVCVVRQAFASSRSS